MWGAYYRLGLPVWASDRAVLRALRKRMRAECLRAPRYREQRRSAYEWILKCHHARQAEYHQAMRGGIWRT